MSGQGPLSDVANRMRSQWRALNPRQRWTVAAIVGGFLLFLFTFEQARLTEYKAGLREQFRLPPGISLTEFRLGTDKSRPPVVEGVVRFDEAQFHNYVATLNEPLIWRPESLRYGGLEITADYASDALHWRDEEPFPRYTGDRLADWGNLSRQRIHQIENGRYFCFAIVFPPDSPRPRDRQSPDGARGLPCWDLASDDRYFIKVQGALDLDARTLHMIVR